MTCDLLILLSQKITQVVANQESMVLCTCQPATFVLCMMLIIHIFVIFLMTFSGFHPNCKKFHGSNADKFGQQNNAYRGACMVPQNNHRTHLPMQNRLKIRSRISSSWTAPVIRPMCSRAIRISVTTRRSSPGVSTSCSALHNDSAVCDNDS